MIRPLRIKYPDAYYHIMFHGNDFLPGIILKYYGRKIIFYYIIAIIATKNNSSSYDY